MPPYTTRAVAQTVSKSAVVQPRSLQIRFCSRPGSGGLETSIEPLLRDAEAGLQQRIAKEIRHADGVQAAFPACRLRKEVPPRPGMQRSRGAHRPSARDAAGTGLRVSQSSKKVVTWLWAMQAIAPRTGSLSQLSAGESDSAKCPSSSNAPFRQVLKIAIGSFPSVGISPARSHGVCGPGGDSNMWTMFVGRVLLPKKFRMPTPTERILCKSASARCSVGSFGQRHVGGGVLRRRREDSPIIHGLQKGSRRATPVAVVVVDRGIADAEKHARHGRLPAVGLEFPDVGGDFSATSSPGSVLRGVRTRSRPTRRDPRRRDPPRRSSRSSRGIRASTRRAASEEMSLAGSSSLAVPTRMMARGCVRNCAQASLTARRTAFSISSGPYSDTIRESVVVEGRKPRERRSAVSGPSPSYNPSDVTMSTSPSGGVQRAVTAAGGSTSGSRTRTMPKGMRTPSRRRVAGPRRPSGTRKRRDGSSVIRPRGHSTPSASINSRLETPSRSSPKQPDRLPWMEDPRRYRLHDGSSLDGRGSAENRHERIRPRRRPRRTGAGRSPSDLDGIGPGRRIDDPPPELDSQRTRGT